MIRELIRMMPDVSNTSIYKIFVNDQLITDHLGYAKVCPN